MVRSIRLASFFGFVVLCGCASAPIEPPSSVAVKTGEVSFDYSSFNARVLNQASAVDASFTTSLREGSLTRLESGYTYKIGDAED